MVNRWEATILGTSTLIVVAALWVAPGVLSAGLATGALGALAVRAAAGIYRKPVEASTALPVADLGIGLLEFGPRGQVWLDPLAGEMLGLGTGTASGSEFLLELVALDDRASLSRWLSLDPCDRGALELSLAGSSKVLRVEPWGVRGGGFRFALSDRTEIASERRSLQRELRDIGFLATHVSDVISRHRLDGRTLYASPSATDVWGVPHSATTDLVLFDLVDEEDRAPVRQWFSRLVETGAASECPYRIRGLDGQARWVETRGVLVRDSESGEPIEVHAVTRDIAERRAREEEWERQQRFVEELYRCIPNLVYVFDLDQNQAVYENRSLNHLLGYGFGSASSRFHTFSPELLHPDDLETVVMRRGKLEYGTDGSVLTSEMRLLRADHNWMWVEVRETVFVRNAEGKATQIIGSLVDISNRKNMDEEIDAYMTQANDKTMLLEIQQGLLAEVTNELRQLASVDGLTGIANHRTFQEELAVRFQNARREGDGLAVTLLDVDEFKKYNDSFGHPAGDEVLRRVAKILRENVREGDFVARYGGEEFAVIFSKVEPDMATSLSERLRAALAAAEWPYRQITGSFGVAALNDGVKNPADLVKMADRALYVSKAEGRNRVTLGEAEPDTFAEAA